MTEERFEDSHECDDGSRIFQCNRERCFGTGHGRKVVSQIRKHWNILRFGFRHVGRRQSKQAAKGKEHHHCNHQHAGTRNDVGTFTFGEVATEVFLILFTLRNHEGRDDWREVKGENHDGNPQPDSDQDTVMTG